MIIPVNANDNGGFTSFVQAGDKVTSSQILGAICCYGSCTSVVSPITGVIKQVYPHAETGNVVHVGFRLYDIDNAPPVLSI